METHTSRSRLGSAGRDGHPAGHIDVSVGALIGVLADPGLRRWAAARQYGLLTVPLLVGIVVNTRAGVLVAYARIPAIVTTLDVLSILKGGLISATDGVWISNLPPDFLIAQFRVFGIPSPVYFMIFLTAIVAVWMRYSGLGRAIPGRRQPGGGAHRRHPTRAHDGFRFCPARFFCRNRRCVVRQRLQALST